MRLRTPSRPLPVALATLTLAIAAATLTPAHAQPGGPGGPGGPGHGAAVAGAPGLPWAGPFGGRRFDRLLEDIGASAEQRQQVRQIMDAAGADLRAQREAGRALHEQMRQLFTQPAVDARAVEALRQQMLAQHDAASRRTMQAMLDVSRVLTVEQRQQIAERMQQRRAKMQRHWQERTPGASRPAS